MNKIAFPFLITALSLFSFWFAPLLLWAGYYQPTVGFAVIILYGGRYSALFLKHLQFKTTRPPYPINALISGVGLVILGLII